jgi:hypothetical protein
LPDACVSFVSVVGYTQLLLATTLADGGGRFGCRRCEGINTSGIRAGLLRRVHVRWHGLSGITATVSGGVLRRPSARETTAIHLGLLRSPLLGLGLIVRGICISRGLLGLLRKGLTIERGLLGLTPGLGLLPRIRSGELGIDHTALHCSIGVAGAHVGIGTELEQDAGIVVALGVSSVRCGGGERIAHAVAFHDVQNQELVLNSVALEALDEVLGGFVLLKGLMRGAGDCSNRTIRCPHRCRVHVVIVRKEHLERIQRQDGIDLCFGVNESRFLEGGDDAGQQRNAGFPVEGVGHLVVEVGEGIESGKLRQNRFVEPFCNFLAVFITPQVAHHRDLGADVCSVIALYGDWQRRKFVSNFGIQSELGDNRCVGAGVVRVNDGALAGNSVDNSLGVLKGLEVLFSDEFAITADKFVNMRIKLRNLFDKLVEVLRDNTQGLEKRVAQWCKHGVNSLRVENGGYSNVIIYR